MWLCEDKLKGKTAHFQLPSVLKSRVLKFSISSPLNVTKTEFLLIGTRQKLSHVKEVPNITINNTPVKQIFSAKSLGLNLDENLNWESHINIFAKKIEQV